MFLIISRMSKVDHKNTVLPIETFQIWYIRTKKCCSQTFR